MVDQITIETCEKQKKECGYAPNPHCKVCGGVGFVHTCFPSGKPDYSNVIHCQMKGCIADQKKLYESTEPYIKG